MRRIVLLIALGALVGALGAARPAGATGPPSAVQQYTEEVPTGSGSHPVSDKAAKTAPVSQPLHKLITDNAGKDAKALIDLTRKKQLGAPPRRKPAAPAAKSALDTARSAASPSGASVIADTAGGSRLPWLVAALLAMAVVALVPLALRGRRR